MPKVKTNSGAKKRFSFTGTGKVKRHHAYHSHILTKKTKKQKRNLDHSDIVVTENMKQVLPSCIIPADLGCNLLNSCIHFFFTQ